MKNLPNLNGRADLRNLKTETKRLLFMSFCFFFISELGVGNVLIAKVVYESRTLSFPFLYGWLPGWGLLFGPDLTLVVLFYFHVLLGWVA